MLPPHAVFPSTHESGEEHEDITDTESEDSINTQDKENELPQPPPKVIEEVFSSMLEVIPRIKEEIEGWCSGNESDEDEDVEREHLQRNPKLEQLRNFIIDSKYYIVSFYDMENKGTEMI